MTHTETLTTPEGPMALYVAEPPAAARGGVVVFQEAFGVNGHIEDVTRRVAAEGYRAVAPHLFHRSGDPVIDYGDHQKLMPHMQALDEKGLMADVDASLAYLEGAGVAAERCAVVGFCMGGTVAFLVALRRRVGAAVTFYGGGVGTGRFGLPPLVDLAPQLQTPWLGLYGDKDQSIPVSDVDALEEAAGRAPVTTQVVRYPDAGHGFHCDQRPDYHPASAQDAWARTLDWFARHLASS